MQPLFIGSGTALATPLTPTDVNLDAFGRLLDFQIQNHTDALIVTGTTGEPSTMSDDERERTWAFAVQHTAGRVPVVIGAGSNNTAHAVHQAEAAAKCGADALLVVTPYYNKCTPNGLFAHYSAIAEVGLPIILYNVPGRTGMDVSPQTLLRLCDIPGIVAVKEASGKIDKMTEMVRLCGDRLTFYSGDDAIVLATLALGFRGVISVVSNICPQKTHDLVWSFERGDLAACRALQFELNPLVELLFCEVSPIPVKTALTMMGFDMGVLRSPLCGMEPQNAQKLRECMVAMGLLV